MRLFLQFSLWALVLMSIATFAVFFVDKRRAVRGARRVRERTLLLLCVLLGAPGGLAAMRMCHHKTKKAPFPYVVPALCAIQVVALLTLLAFS